MKQKMQCVYLLLHLQYTYYKCILIITLSTHICSRILFIAFWYHSLCVPPQQILFKGAGEWIRSEAADSCEDYP